MKQIQAQSWKERVRSVQGKAKFVGVAYLCGTVALAAAVMIVCVLTGTCLSTENGFLPIVAFFKEITGLFSNGIGAVFASAESILKLLILLIYAGLALTAVICVFCALFKLDWLFKRRASKLYGFNRNMYAMDDISKCYSVTLGAIVVCNLLICLLSLEVVDGVMTQQISLFGGLLLGVGILLHFFLGLLEGKVSLFTTGEKIEEEKREFGLSVYFWRNLVQLVAVVAVLWFFVPQSQCRTTLVEMLTEVAENKNFGWVMKNLIDLIPFAVEILAWIFVIAMIKHTLNSTEFRRESESGTNMKNFAACSFFAFLCVAALIVLPYFGIGLADGETATLNVSLIIVAAICFAVFLFDCICRPRKKKVVQEPASEEIELDVVEESSESEEEEEETTNNLIYIPVYYPIVANGEGKTTTFDAPFLDSLRPAPMPAPSYLTPVPSPETKAAEEAERKKEEDATSAEKQWQGRCPNCGKELLAKAGTNYHRCPHCDKVFEIKKFQVDVK